MSRSWWLKCVLLLSVTVFSALYVYPTLSPRDLEKSKFPFKQKMNLGLDLQGGLYLVLGVDFNKVFKDIIQRQGEGLKDRLKEKALLDQNHEVTFSAVSPDDPHVSLHFSEARREDVYKILKKEFPSLRLVGESAGKFELGISHDYRSELREKTVGQSIEVIRNRIDQFGVAEPSITSQGNDRVVVELPGVKEVDRAKDLIGRTAKLEFKMVDEKSKNPEELFALIQELEKKHQLTFNEGDKFSEYVRKLNEYALGKIPAGEEIVFERSKYSQKQGEEIRIPYLVFSKAEVTGSDLQDASVQINPENQKPEVAFSLNPRGAGLFDQLTAQNIGKKLAIVLDNTVHSAPVINSRIPEGRGSISIGQGGDSAMKEAKDLALVLRAGALPAQLDFLEQRVVGPSLGQDSIQKGALASLVGCLAVFLFVCIYYKLSGLIAVFSLILNVLFVLAIFVGLEATLTLPGIAGIALTVGIAVDSNVVIYERIREELRLGKRPFIAVEAGFQKAFRTILDANVTNAIAGVILMMYGTGPIKGFAVALLVGIVTTLFTAIFVCRLIFDLYLHILENRNAKTLSI